MKFLRGSCNLLRLRLPQLLQQSLANQYKLVRCPPSGRRLGSLPFSKRGGVQIQPITARFPWLRLHVRCWSISSALDRDPTSAHCAWHDEEPRCGESTGCHHTRFFKGVWHHPSPPTTRQTGALRCQRQSSGMDWVLPDWTYTISTCRWCMVEGGGSDVRCSPRYRPRTTPLYPLHKWPPSPGALGNTLPPLCGWLLAVPCHPSTALV